MEMIDDRTSAELKIRSLSLFPEENPFPVLRANADGMLLYANRASATLLSRWDCAVGSQVPEEIRRQLQAVLAHRRHHELEVDCGDRRLSFVLVPIGDGNYVNFYGRDITEKLLTEKQLRESEVRYRDLVEHANSAIIRWRADGILTFINDYAQRFFGYTAAEAIGKPVSLLLPDRETNGNDLSGLIRDIVAHPERYRSNVNENICSDGRRVWMTWTNQPIFDADGQVCEILAIGSDITERRRIELELHQSEERLHLALDAAFVISFEWDIQRDEVRRFVSHETTLAVTPLEHPETFEDVVAVVHPDDRELFRRNVAVALTRADGIYENEFRIVSPGGAVVWLYERGLVKRDAAGRPALLFGISQDISKRKLAEESLRESEERFRQLADAMPQLVWTADATGRVDYYNSRYREFKGLVRQPDGNWDWAPVLHPDDMEKTVEAWQHAVRSGETYQLEHRVQRADNSFAWYLSRAKPVHDLEGRVVRWYGTATDIDDLKTAEMEIEAARKSAELASRAKSDFVANMSHEIRTPMTVFLMATEQLLHITTDPQCRELLDLAEKAAKSLRSLVDDILDFSRIEARSVRIEKQPFDLRGCIAEALEMFRLVAREKNLDLSADIAPEVPFFIVGDHDRLRQILINLIGNAVKFTPEGGVDVAVCSRDDFIEIAVIDTGIGIPDEKLPLLFNSFSQLDTSFCRRYGGSGLGLAISKGLVELMGGMIRVQGRERGTAFIVTLPLRLPEEPAVAAAAPTAGANRQATCMHILLAEDDPSIRKVINLALAGCGLHIEVAATGCEAVEKWRRGPFDLILMDLQMPGMNGLEATRVIRAREAFGSRIPIIGITAHAGAEILDECRTAGMDQVLPKPLQINDLLAAIDRFREDSASSAR